MADKNPKRRRKYKSDSIADDNETAKLSSLETTRGQSSNILPTRAPGPRANLTKKSRRGTGHSTLSTIPIAPNPENSRECQKSETSPIKASKSAGAQPEARETFRINLKPKGKLSELLASSSKLKTLTQAHLRESRTSPRVHPSESAEASIGGSLQAPIAVPVPIPLQTLPAVPVATLSRNSSSLSSLSSMSSQGRRQPRSGPRGGIQDSGEEQDVWDGIRAKLFDIQKSEKKAADLKVLIFDQEKVIAEQQRNKVEPTIAQLDTLSALYREQVRIAEDQKANAVDADDIVNRIVILKGMVKHNEEMLEAQAGSARGSSSRGSALGEYDGPFDSHPASPHPEKIRKIANASRTSSQPPRSATDSRPDTAPSDAGETTRKPKIVYAEKEEVAFKRKSDQDWILGRVVKVIGEGKSRRYDVQDPYPDETSATPGGNIYKSSASQMVPIPPEGSVLENYEPGKRVLALYPETTTFYRAEVKKMAEGGRVELLFEEELGNKLVDRRWVLDHKG